MIHRIIRVAVAVGKSASHQIQIRSDDSGANRLHLAGLAMNDDLSNLREDQNSPEQTKKL